MGKTFNGIDFQHIPQPKMRQKSAIATFIVNFRHFHESTAHKKIMGIVIILAGFEINVFQVPLAEPIFGCGKQTATDSPATCISIDKNIAEHAERRAAVGIGFEDAEAEQLSCGIFRLEHRRPFRRHVFLYIYKPQMTAVRIELRDIFLTIENQMPDSHLHLAMGNIFDVLRQMRIKQISKRVLVLNRSRCNDNILHIYYAIISLILPTMVRTVLETTRSIPKIVTHATTITTTAAR